MTLSCLEHGNPPEIKLNFFRNCDLSEVTLFRAQALRVKRYSYWICVRRKRAGADGGFTAVQLHADKNRRAPHGHVAEPNPASSRSRSTSKILGTAGSGPAGSSKFLGTVDTDPAGKALNGYGFGLGSVPWSVPGACAVPVLQQYVSKCAPMRRRRDFRAMAAGVL